MVERIEKTDRHEYWQVQSSAETHKDRGQKESQQDAYAPLGDHTDWKHLLDKSNLWKRNIQITRADIGRIVFQKVNLKSDPSLLRVDMELSDGSVISPAFLAISRMAALKIKNLNPGDVLSPDQIGAGSTLRITVPTNPEIFKKAERQNAAAPSASTELGDQSDTLAIQKLVRKTGLAGFLKREIRTEIFVAAAISMFVLMLILWGYLYLQR